MKLFLLTGLFLGHALSAPGPSLLGKRDITPQEFSSLGLFAQYAAASHCNYANSPGQAITCANNACPLVQASNAKMSLGFTSEVTDVAGYIGIDPTRSLIILSFRGSESIENWITNILFLKVTCPLTPGCKVHLGFAAAWEELSATVTTGIAVAKAAHPGYSLVITGYSLGGAVATLAAAYLRNAGHAANLYTYGSPRVGNEQFVRFVTEQPGSEYRVTHTDDPVPKLPPQKIDYRHTSPEYWIITDENVVASGADISICSGFDTKGCNAGTPGFNLTAHVWYLGPIAGCGGGASILGRDGEPEVQGQGGYYLESKLREYIDMDN